MYHRYNIVRTYQFGTSNIYASDHRFKSIYEVWYSTLKHGRVSFHSITYRLYDRHILLEEVTILSWDYYNV